MISSFLYAIKFWFYFACVYRARRSCCYCSSSAQIHHSTYIDCRALTIINWIPILAKSVFIYLEHWISEDYKKSTENTLQHNTHKKLFHWNIKKSKKIESGFWDTASRKFFFGCLLWIVCYAHVRSLLEFDWNRKSWRLNFFCRGTSKFLFFSSSLKSVSHQMTL